MATRMLERGDGKVQLVYIYICVCVCVKKLYFESVGYNKFKISLYKFMHGEGDVLYSMATCILERGDGKVQLVVCVHEN